MQKGLVSLLTPMYNMEKFVHRLLDSVLKQTYPYIEMVVIDDGSTDQSSHVIDSYKPQFEARGYSLKYVYQENGGQSVAIRNGLKLINGEYLAWPDADDFYAADDAIEQMVGVLQTSDESFQMVRTQGVIVEDGTLRQIGYIGQGADEEKFGNMFEDCLLVRNGFYFCSGAYLVKVKALHETTGFDIYTSKDAGQNWQLLLPVLYKYRCQTIRRPLYNVVAHAQSHSRKYDSDYKGVLRQYSEYLSTQVGTLKRIKGLSDSCVKSYENMLKADYNKKLLYEAIRENLRDIANERFHLCQAHLDNTFERLGIALLLKIKGGTYILNWSRYGIMGCKKYIHKVFKRK